jgi:hypothetical protein
VAQKDIIMVQLVSGITAYQKGDVPEEIVGRAKINCGSRCAAN